MKKLLVSLALLISAPALMAGKPAHNNRLALILAAEKGDLETISKLVEKGLVTHRTMNAAIAEAYNNNLAKLVNKIYPQTQVIEYLFDHGAIHEGPTNNYSQLNKKTIKLLCSLGAIKKNA